MTAEMPKDSKRKKPLLPQRGKEDSQARIAAVFNAIYDQSTHFGGILSLEGILLNANRAACELIGMDPFDVGGTPFWETPWWAHSATEQEKLRDGIRRASRGEPVHFETTHVSADGTVRSVDFTLKPARDKSGRPFCLIAEARDVTEAKRTQEEHRASESMLSGVFRATPIGITFNIARVIHSANDSMCELTGYGEHELVGKSARIFYDSQEEFERVGRELYQQLPQKGRTMRQVKRDLRFNPLRLSHPWTVPTRFVSHRTVDECHSASRLARVTRPLRENWNDSRIEQAPFQPRPEPAARETAGFRNGAHGLEKALGLQFGRVVTGACAHDEVLAAFHVQVDGVPLAIGEQRLGAVQKVVLVAQFVGDVFERLRHVLDLEWKERTPAGL